MGKLLDNARKFIADKKDKEGGPINKNWVDKNKQHERTDMTTELKEGRATEMVMNGNELPGLVKTDATQVDNQNTITETWLNHKFEGVWHYEKAIHISSLIEDDSYNKQVRDRGDFARNHGWGDVKLLKESVTHLKGLATSFFDTVDEGTWRIDNKGRFPFPAVTLYEIDKVKNNYIVIHGNHRLHVYAQRKILRFDAYILPQDFIADETTRKQAIAELQITANLVNGANMPEEEKIRRAIELFKSGTYTEKEACNRVLVSHSKMKDVLAGNEVRDTVAPLLTKKEFHSERWTDAALKAISPLLSKNPRAGADAIALLDKAGFTGKQNSSGESNLGEVKAFIAEAVQGLYDSGLALVFEKYEKQWKNRIESLGKGSKPGRVPHADHPLVMLKKKIRTLKARLSVAKQKEVSAIPTDELIEIKSCYDDHVELMEALLDLINKELESRSV